MLTLELEATGLVRPMSEMGLYNSVTDISKENVFLKMKPNLNMFLVFSFYVFISCQLSINCYKYF